MIGLYFASLETPIGEMLSISDDSKLYLLHFADATDDEVVREMQAEHGTTAIHKKLKLELEKYFSGTKFDFTIPIYRYGTELQQNTLEVLQKLDCGTTCSYTDIATKVGKSKAYRAVATAIAQNRYAIIVPCHRIVPKSGGYGEYNGGSWRKEWLLKHEAKYR